MSLRNNMPTFSIVSMVKNIESIKDQFQRSVESVLNQTDDDFEFIIQDGESTDKTKEIILEFSDKRIICISEPDSGPMDGLFRALRQCRGKYIGSCFSDEELAPDALESARKVFFDNPRIAAFYGNYGSVNENGEKWGLHIPGHPFNIENYVCQRLVPPYNASFFCRYNLEKAGLYTHNWRFNIAEFELWIRVAATGKIHYHPQLLSYFGRNKKSHTANSWLYEYLTSNRAAIMSKIFEENEILQDTTISVENAISENYIWGANSVKRIEGESERYKKLIQLAHANTHSCTSFSVAKSYITKITPVIDNKDTPEIIKEAIFCEYKDLKYCTSDKNIHTTVQCLRDWTSRFINISCPEKKIAVRNLESSYLAFNNLQAGVWCGGAASFHAMILRLFNIASTTLGYTYPGSRNLSHAVTIYAAPSKRTIDFYVSDAYFNHYFHNISTGDPITLNELFHKIINKNYSSISVSNLPAIRACVVTPDFDPNDLWFFPQEKRVEPLIKPDRWIYPNALLTLQGMTTLDPFWKNNIESLRGSLSSEEFMYELMLYNHKFGNFGNIDIDKEFKNFFEYVNNCLKNRNNLFQDINTAQQKKDTASMQATSKQKICHTHASEITKNTIKLEGWLNILPIIENRLYYRDQTVESLNSLTSLTQPPPPTVIVELGTLSGMSTRAWTLAVPTARVHAVDLSFKSFWKANAYFPVDTSRITFHEQNILAMDFKTLWSDNDRVLFFVDAHDLANVPIMQHVLKNALPYLPKDSLVVVDDIWFSQERLGPDNVQEYFDKFLLGQIDELQCFAGHFAPYHMGGSFMGFREVLPLMEFINSRGIDLGYDPGGKHVWFPWDGERHKNQKPVQYDQDERESGFIEYNPLAVRANEPLASRILPKVARLYQKGQLQESLMLLVDLINKEPSQSACFALAVCLARLGQLDDAYKLAQLARQAGKEDWRVNRMADDLKQRVGRPKVRMTGRKGLTIFAVPKAFKGHEAIIQKNAIRSWARLDPKPEILLMGNDPGVREMALEVGARHIPDIATNEFGTPLVNDIFKKAWDTAANDILAYVNTDIILFDDFMAGTEKATATHKEFLLVGRRWDLCVCEQIDFETKDWRRLLLDAIAQDGFLHAETGLDFFVHTKCLWAGMPPFALGRCAWDNWLMKWPLLMGKTTIDATEYITAIHQDHGYSHAGGRTNAFSGLEPKRNRAMAGSVLGWSTDAHFHLTPEGQIIRREPLPPSFDRPEAKTARVRWLIVQAGKLMAKGYHELAAVKYEEASRLQPDNARIAEMLATARNCLNTKNFIKN